MTIVSYLNYTWSLQWTLCDALFYFGFSLDSLRSFPLLGGKTVCGSGRNGGWSRDFSSCTTCLRDKDEYVKKNASILIKKIAQHIAKVKIKSFLNTIILVSFLCKVKHQFVYKVHVLCHTIWRGQGFSSRALCTFWTR